MIIVNRCQQLAFREKRAVKNLDIRMMVSDYGMKYRDIADEMNISRQHLSRLLRYELTPDNKIRVMRAIDNLARGELKNGRDCM